MTEFESYRFDFYPSEDGCYRMQRIEAARDELSLLDLIAEDMKVSPLSVGRLFSFLGSVMPRMTLGECDHKMRLFREAREYIARNTGFRVPELARYLGMSVSGVYAFFKSYGTTPIETKNRLLVERARELLVSTDLPVEEIIGITGLETASYFRKLMRAYTGKTPGEIRLDAAKGKL